MEPKTQTTDEPVLYGFLVLPGFPMACLTSAIEPLRAANEISGRQAFRWLVISENSEPVVSSAGVRFDPDTILADVQHCHATYVMGSPTATFLQEKQTPAILRRMARSGSIIGGFSGGLFSLATTGLLDGHKCSIHWVYEAAFATQFPDIERTDRVITVDRKRETASGSAAVFDLMLRHIENTLGTEMMTEVACWFQHPYVRGDDIAQRIPARRTDTTRDMLPDTVADAVRLFAEHVEEPLRVADVAAAVNVSTRQLDRAFQRATGQSPLKYYRMVRLEKARQMVLYSSDTIADIALATGYSSNGPFIRQYREAFGLSPSDHRAESNRFRIDNNGSIPAL